MIIAVEQKGEQMSDLIKREDAIRAIEFGISHIVSFDGNGQRTNYFESENAELAKAIERVKEIPSANQWIPCSERLPEDTGDYLVWALFVCEEYPTYSIVHYDADCEAFGEWNDFYDTHTLGFLDSEFEEIEGVIAWMPLPEPYRGDNDE